MRNALKCIGHGNSSHCVTPTHEHVTCHCTYDTIFQLWRYDFNLLINIDRIKYGIHNYRLHFAVIAFFCTWEHNIFKLAWVCNKMATMQVRSPSKCRMLTQHPWYNWLLTLLPGCEWEIFSCIWVNYIKPTVLLINKWYWKLNQQQTLLVSSTRQIDAYLYINDMCC